MNDEQKRTQDNLSAVARQLLAEDKPQAAPSGLKQKLKKWGPVGALVLFAFGKFKWLIAGLKFAKLGSLLTMLLAVVVYAQFFGWPFAVGFVLLIFVHEMGHALAMRQQGLRAGVPVFIPFVGAVIAMKDLPKNAWVEAVVGIGGPFLGTVGAAITFGLAMAFQSDLLYALASVGFLINLFNMIPLSPLDGGRIVGVFGRWMWVLGYLIAGIVLLVTWSPILILILLMGLMNLKRILKPPPGYNDVETWRRATMAVAYFAGIGIMVGGMIAADANLEHIRPVEAFALWGGDTAPDFGGLIGSRPWKRSLRP